MLQKLMPSLHLQEWERVGRILLWLLVIRRRDFDRGLKAIETQLIKGRGTFGYRLKAGMSIWVGVWVSLATIFHCDDTGSQRGKAMEKRD